jgi:hypothetical protein
MMKNIFVALITLAMIQTSHTKRFKPILTEKH